MQCRYWGMDVDRFAPEAWARGDAPPPEALVVFDASQASIFEWAANLAPGVKRVGYLAPTGAGPSREVAWFTPIHVPLRPRALEAALRGLRRGAPAVADRPRSSKAALPQFGLKVLAAEDNPDNQRVLSRILGKLGCDLTLAEDGAELLTLWRNQRYDLVLMDCHMPVMDGFEATRILRAEESQGHVPVVAVTAGAMPEDEAQALNAGMDDYVSKPLTVQRVAELLARWKASF
jgi:CheY-like chemotaxis protein